MEIENDTTTTIDSTTTLSESGTEPNYWIKDETTVTDEPSSEDDNIEAQPETSVLSDIPLLDIPDKYKDEDGNVDIEKLAKGYKNLASKIGNTKLDIPESINDYNIDENFKSLIPESDMQGFLEEAHSQGFTNSQLNFLLEQFQSQEGELQRAEVAVSTLKEVWGANNYNKNLKLADKAFNAFVDPQDAGEFKNNIAAIKLLAEIGRQMGEASPVRGNSASKQSEAEILEIMRSPKYYSDPSLQKIVMDFYNK